MRFIFSKAHENKDDELFYKCNQIYPLTTIFVDTVDKAPPSAPSTLAITSAGTRPNLSILCEKSRHLINLAWTCKSIV